MGDWEYNAKGKESITATNLMSLFDYCSTSNDYKATTYGCQCIIDEWKKKADVFDERFKNIPGYIEGEHCIVLKNDWLRQTDKNEIRKFANRISNYGEQQYIINKVNGMTLREYELECCTLDNYVCCIKNLPASALNYHGVRQIRERRKFIQNILCDMTMYTKESMKIAENIVTISNCLYNYTEQFLNEEIVEQFNKYYPELKFVVGKKTSKAVRKFCQHIGMTETEDFEKYYAAYADAINPLKVSKNVVISWNLYDYLTMSQGNTWYSCHDIYDWGCYSSGTLSYALDKVSVVVYMLPDDYKELDQPLWNIPKVKRQMFHINTNGNTFIQARLYPDDQTDHGYGTEFGAYENWRHMMQEIISKAYDLTNLWKNKRGTNEIAQFIRSRGTHYRDYNHYENCNMSYINNDEGIEQIEIGHYPICPSCGCEHSDEASCTCEDCLQGYEICATCGCRIDPDDVIWYNDEPYCYDCTSWCEYHEQREPGGADNYIRGYGDVCDDALESMRYNGEICECEACGEYVFTESEHYIEYEDEETGEVHDFCSCGCRNRIFPRMA